MRRIRCWQRGLFKGGGIHLRYRRTTTRVAPLLYDWAVVSMKGDVAGGGLWPMASQIPKYILPADGRNAACGMWAKRSALFPGRESKRSTAEPSWGALRTDDSADSLYKLYQAVLRPAAPVIAPLGAGSPCRCTPLYTLAVTRPMLGAREGR